MYYSNYYNIKDIQICKNFALYLIHCIYHYYPQIHVTLYLLALYNNFVDNLRAQKNYNPIQDKILFPISRSVTTAHVEMRKTSKNDSETLEMSVKSEKNEIFGKVCNSAHWHHRMLILVSTKNNQKWV